MRRTRVKKRVIPTPKRIGGNLPKLSSDAKKFLSSLPRMRLSNFDLIRLARAHKIPRFRGVFMIDELPRKPWKNECAIFNLDTSYGKGTHWVCYKKLGNFVRFFDSSGARPPSELVRYLKGYRILSNRKLYQSIRSNNCGQLCLLFLLGLL